MRSGLVAALLAIALNGSALAQAQPLLQLQGQPYFGGSLTLHMTGSVGQPALLAYGLNPLPLHAPLHTGKGPWFIGSSANLLPLGLIPSGGRIDLQFGMPPLMPALAGIPLVLQGYVPFALSNPATLPLDLPYFIPSTVDLIISPNPQFKGEFGKYTSAGDLNGDGFVDLVIAAHKEDYLGIDMSGRVYVHWGPDFDTVTTLSPPSPVIAGFYGIGSAVADLDGVPPDDLVIAETAGDPAPPGNPAKLYIFTGGSVSGSPTHTILSPGTGSEYSAYGAFPCVGDYNADGENDLAVGFPKADVAGIVDAGRIDVFFGPDFTVRVPVFSPAPVQAGGFGVRVAAADINGDDITDLIEASPATPLPPWTLVGSLHTFVGPDLTHSLTIPCPEPLGSLTRFGDMLEVGDLNGDGVAELCVADAKNRVFVFWSPAYTTYLTVPKPPSFQPNPFGETAYGAAMAIADINGDERLDLLIADTFEGEEGCAISSAGRVLGALAPYFSSFHRIGDFDPQCGDNFGSSIIATELDGDSRVELVIGANFSDDVGLLSSGHAAILD